MANCCGGWDDENDEGWCNARALGSEWLARCRLFFVDEQPGVQVMDGMIGRPRSMGEARSRFGWVGKTTGTRLLRYCGPFLSFVYNGSSGPSLPIWLSRRGQAAGGVLPQTLQNGGGGLTRLAPTADDGGECVGESGV